MRRIKWSMAGVCAALTGALVVWAAGVPAPGSGAAGPTVALEGVYDDGLWLLMTPTAAKAGVLEVELLNLDGKLLAKAVWAHDGKPRKVQLSAPIDRKDLANYYLRYRTDEKEAFERRSLFFLGEILETTVLAEREYLGGTTPVVRVLVRDRAAGRPLAGAQVAVALVHEGRTVAGYAARTDDRGEVAAPLALPPGELAGAQLTVDVASKTAKETVTGNVSVKSATQTMLTTDKPLYQPGQVIHIRALSLTRPKMEPLKEKDVTFEVEDSKGNKVFKRQVRTDDYGVSHADFVLADELNLGAYRVRAVVAGAKEEKTVTVDRYVLPKFKLDFKSDRQFYQPGETVKCELQVDYFFGKPVAGGRVEIKCAKFDVQYLDFQTIQGKTDEKGHYSFEVPLPKDFVGQPLEQGKAHAKLEIAVIDTADHKETVTRNVTVTGAPIIVAAVPESGDLVPGLENQVYIVTTYADSTPAECTVQWLNARSTEPVIIKTDQAGFGVLALTPQAGQGVNLELAARDAKGHTGKATIALQFKARTDDSVLLRTDKSLYRVGEPVAFSIVSTKKVGSIYVDLIKDRQTYLTRTLDLKDGKAEAQLTLDASHAGTVELSAYLIGANGVIVRDRRLVIVDPADDLKVAVTPDEETYLPGAYAKVKFTVTDKRGAGVAAALGVIVVDEAVFALQEMQPGLEKVYFYLEKEIATPRYEIHGWSLDVAFPPSELTPAPDAMPAARRDTAARVLLASAKGAGEHTVFGSASQGDDKTAPYVAKMVERMRDRYQKVQDALDKSAPARQKDQKPRLSEGVTLDALVRQGYLKADDIRDPWGGDLKVTGSWCRSCQNYHGFFLSSAGIDGKWGTADDVTGDALGPSQGGGGRKGRLAEGFDKVLALGVRPPMAPMEAGEAAPAPGRPKVDEDFKKDGGKPEESAGAEPPRIRRYFPETLYFNPAVITDGRGQAAIDIPIADSITTWRMTCLASSLRGQLGSTTAPLRVFQDFFVDIDFPVALTQNDQVHVPVVVYNYLKTDQTVRLKVEQADWFTLKGEPEVSVKLGPSEVMAVHFPIVAKQVGNQTFTVTGYGTKKSDAVARTVDVAPDGKEFLISFSGRLEGAVAHTVTIPETAIPGASKVFIKVYPGVLSQVVEGLDKMLRMPSGCFEQTSSVTYPNILVLDYMKTTGKITPELQMKAEGFVNSGYQRLLAYEVKGGGFEWFGNAPAHPILTAYGLMEFFDMSKVHAVDPNVIARTQAWLAKLQQEDGSYKPASGGIREGAIDKFTDDVFRITSYITWALASTGYQGPEVAKGLKYIEKHLDELKDTYTLALTANTFAAVDPKGKTTATVLKTLSGKRQEKDDVVWWSATSETATHGSGRTADMEVTGLAVQAFVKCGHELGAVSKAVTYLARNKDAYGTWQSTQATIQAMRGMLMAERGATAGGKATITVALNGEPQAALRVDETNSDVLQLVDLKEKTKTGDHAVTLKVDGQGALLYQVVGRYYLPYPREAAVPDEPISIKLEYDRTQLAAEDILGVTATATNNRPGVAKMVVLDLGLPPGFTLLPEELNRLVAEKTIEKYTTTGRQIIVYLSELAAGKPVQVKYNLWAKYPLRAKTAKSVAYEYYNPDVRGESKPVELEVTKAGR